MTVTMMIMIMMMLSAKVEGQQENILCKSYSYFHIVNKSHEKINNVFVLLLIFSNFRGLSAALSPLSIRQIPNL